LFVPALSLESAKFFGARLATRRAVPRGYFLASMSDPKLLGLMIPSLGHSEQTLPNSLRPTAPMAASTPATKSTAVAPSNSPSSSNSDCATSKTRSSQERSDLRNSTVDEDRPLEPTCRSRTQITFRCCVLTDVVVSGEGKGPEAKFGSDDFQEEDRKGTTVSRVEKSQDDV
jgi:hypothetical protein